MEMRGEIMATDLKKICAQEALELIKPGMTVGLGGGGTIGYLVELLKSRPDLHIKVITPSINTKMLCLNSGLEVIHPLAVAQIDLAFDGCDEVDENLNALKSGGGIHTKEKLIATMAKEYILLVDQSKVVPVLTFKNPVVLEVLEDALAYVLKEVKLLKGQPTIRTSFAKDGFTITENGNILIDVQFPAGQDIACLEANLQGIFGVVATSLFVNQVTKVLVIDDHGNLKILK